jgi:hypothetical protein
VKQFSFCLLVLFAMEDIAHNQPMSSFPSGQYLGLGNYITTDGTEGTYASYADITSDSWNITQYRNGKSYSYNFYFSFNNYGFFDVKLVDNSDPNNPVEYIGRGYCWSAQCFVEVPLDNNLIFEETVTFPPQENNIYWLGSIRPSDVSVDDPSISWEESMGLINSPCDIDE